MILEGYVWKFGHEIDTDIIVPSRYLELAPDEYKEHLMEPVRPDFNSVIQKGDIIFAGKGFGIGSSRGQAVVAIKETGIKGIVAISFGRIFFRSAINDGLVLIECPEAYNKTDEGDLVQINILSGIVKNKTKGTEFSFQQFDDLILKIILAGGGVNYYKKLK
jgi:3-isopropylmalate/(R)-2-methylmalate dehydratase small subunit